jgi:hypothetical protein
LLLHPDGWFSIVKTLADAVIFVALFAIVGAVIGLFAFAQFSVINGDWVPAAITASIASLAGAALAALWLKS